MSAVSRMRDVARLALGVSASIVGWLILAPVAWLVPKQRDRLAVIGASGGQFRDNAKYFFLHASAIAHARIAFITERSDVSALRVNGWVILRYPRPRAAWFLARSAVIVVDEASWFKHGRRFLTAHAHVVQLWHGVGGKRVELDRWTHEAGQVAWASGPVALRLRLLSYRVTGRLTRYAAVVCTSRFYRDAVFRSAFSAEAYPITGYPRNDFARSLRGAAQDLAWSNVDGLVKSQLQEWRARGRRLVLVTPTYRDSGTEPMQLDEHSLQAIGAFAEGHGVEFLFKFHPSERNVDHIAGRHFHVCARDSDIYPLMPYAAALVTDYSSISMDFLLVDKPLLFLIPENDGYTTRDRELQFDPRTMMPGPIVPTWEALLAALQAEWSDDHFVAERAALRSKAFDDLPQSEAVPKLLAFMRAQGWIADRSAPHTGACTP